MIIVLEKGLAAEVPLNIKNPEVIWNDLADWAVDEPEDLVWRFINESYIEDLEEKERSCFDVDGLNTDMDDCDEYKAAEVAVDATICHETDENDDDHRFAIALVNAMFDYSAKQSLNRLMLQTLGFAVLGIGVGLAFGLGLGLGAHVHIAITVLSSVISAALTFVLSARYNYHRFMGPESASTHTQQAYRPSVIASNTTPGNNQQATETSMTNSGIQELDPGSVAGKQKLSFQS